MLDDVVAERYSRALFALALKQGISSEIGGELNDVLRVISGAPGLTQYLNNPRVPDENKTDLFKKVFGERLKDTTVNFLMLLIKKNRWACFMDAVDIYQTLLDQSEGRQKASFVTAVPVTKETEEKIKGKLAALTGKKIELRVEVNPSIIGGAAIYLPGVVIDGSIQAGLKSLKEKLLTLRVH
ncbi:MAG: ATP synthase F1 subunit delta [Candidatus Omnitrophica bacterium]|nr:ATP synthase F1 subunit delta [Candidatus Omnitrophota bacterium]